MKDLMLSDRITTVLLVYILWYILLVEEKSDNLWLPPYELSKLIDNFVANHAGNTPKASSLGIPNAQAANERNGNTLSQDGRQKPDVSNSEIPHTREKHYLLKKLAQGEIQEQLV